MNRPYQAVHGTLTHREDTTRQVVVLMRRMWCIMVVHAERPSWQLYTPLVNLLQFALPPQWSPAWSSVL